MSLFGGIFLVLQLLYFLIPDDFLREEIYFHGIVSVCAFLMNNVGTGMHVTASDNILQSAQIVLEVVRGCDGAATLFLLLAAMMAFRCDFKYKIKGMVLGFLMLYGLNLLRIIGLFYVLVHRPAWFNPVHLYFAPIFFVLIIAVFFLFWVGNFSKQEAS